MAITVVTKGAYSYDDGVNLTLVLLASSTISALSRCTLKVESNTRNRTSYSPKELVLIEVLA